MNSKRSLKTLHARQMRLDFLLLTLQPATPKGVPLVVLKPRFHDEMMFYVLLFVEYHVDIEILVFGDVQELVFHHPIHLFVLVPNLLFALVDEFFLR